MVKIQNSKKHMRNLKIMATLFSTRNTTVLSMMWTTNYVHDVSSLQTTLIEAGQTKERRKNSR